MYSSIYVFLLASNTFRRKALWVTLYVCAIIVNHVVLLYPFQPLPSCGVQRLWKPWNGVGVGVWVWRARRFSRWQPNTSIRIVVTEGSNERSLSPVCLDTTASCCPIICIPQTSTYPHRPIFWIGNVVRLQVIEYTNWCTINVEAGTSQNYLVHNPCYKNYFNLRDKW